MEIFYAASLIKGRGSSQLSSKRSMTVSYNYNQPMKEHRGNAIEKSLESVYRSNLYSEGRVTTHYVKVYHTNEAVSVGNKITEEEDPKKTSGVPDLVLMDYLMDKKLEQIGKETLRGEMQKAFYKAMGDSVYVLAKGRSTYDVITDSSMQARDALRNWIRATDFKGKTIRELINKHNQIRSEQLTLKGKTWMMAYHPKLKRKVRRLLEFDLKYDEYEKRCYTLLSFLKHAERTKEEPRAIFSAGITWRAYIYVLEKVFEVVNKMDPSSSILLGSDRKIQNTKAAQREMVTKMKDKVVVSLTGDNSKFNETQSPETMIQFILKMELEEEMTNCLVFAMHMFTQKRVKVPKGQKRESSDLNVTMNLEELLKNRSAQSGAVRKFLEKVSVSEAGAIRAPRGMLMGMANYAFTTVATFASGFSFNGNSVMTHQSSDDFVSTATGENESKAISRLEMALKVSKAAGLNVSTKKTYINGGLTWEFNSLFVVDNQMVRNAGNIESSTEPGGLGPSTDLFMIGKTANNTRLRGNCSFSTSRQIAMIGLRKNERLYLTNNKLKELKRELRGKIGDEVNHVPYTMGGTLRPTADEIMQGFEALAFKDAVANGKWLAAEWILTNSNIEAEELSDRSWDSSKGEMVTLRADEGTLRRRKVKPKRKEDREIISVVAKRAKVYEEIVDKHPELLISESAKNLTLGEMSKRGWKVGEIMKEAGFDV